MRLPLCWKPCTLFTARAKIKVANPNQPETQRILGSSLLIRIGFDKLADLLFRQVDNSGLRRVTARHPAGQDTRLHASRSTTSRNSRAVSGRLLLRNSVAKRKILSLLVRGLSRNPVREGDHDHH